MPHVERNGVHSEPRKTYEVTRCAAQIDTAGLALPGADVVRERGKKGVVGSQSALEIRMVVIGLFLCREKGELEKAHCVVAGGVYIDEGIVERLCGCERLMKLVGVDMQQPVSVN